MMFMPYQQELDCISASGGILGKIRFDFSQDKHIFSVDDGVSVTEDEARRIEEHLKVLDAGQSSIAMPDDD